jgi:hypothetical protein
MVDSPRNDELEKVVGRVKDVLRARVVRDEDGKVSEVRVLTGESKSPQKIARDVTSVIRSRGEEVAPENIRVAQMTTDDWTEIAGVRLRLESVLFESRSMSAEARITLMYGKREVVGAAAGLPASRESMKIVAAATLNAVQACLDPCPDLTVEGVSAVLVGGVDTVVVLVSACSPEGIEVFSGSCPVRFDRRDAAARATLDAINRKFALAAKGAIN